MPCGHLAEYNTHRYNVLHKHTQHWSIDWNRCGGVRKAMPVCDTIVSTISRMLHAVAAVVMIILSLVGDRKNACVASESCRIFPRDKNPDYEVWKEQILSGIGEDPYEKIRINRRFWWRKTLEISRTSSFIRFWRRSGLVKLLFLTILRIV